MVLGKVGIMVHGFALANPGGVKVIAALEFSCEPGKTHVIENEEINCGPYESLSITQETITQQVRDLYPFCPRCGARIVPIFFKTKPISDSTAET